MKEIVVTIKPLQVTQIFGKHGEELIDSDIQHWLNGLIGGTDRKPVFAKLVPSGLIQFGSTMLPSSFCLNLYFENPEEAAIIKFHIA